MDEINDIYHAVDSTVNPQGKESRNVLQQLAETRQAKTIYNVIDSRLQIAENQEDIAKAFEGVSEDLGYKVKVIFTDPSNSPQLIGVDENGNEYIKNGTAYVDKKTGINYILINSESPANRTKAGVIGTIAEEQSHIIGKIEGRQKTVPDGSEKGLESLGRPTNNYFKNQYSKNDKAIGLKSDGRDYSNVDFGENVGDHISPEDLKYRKYYREEVLPYDENYQNFLRNILSMGLDFSPLGTGKGITEGIVGYDTVTGEKLDLATRIIGAIPIANGIFKTGRRAIKFLKPAKKVETVLVDGSKVVLNVDDTIKTANKAQEIISSSGTTKVVAKETKVIDKTTDITKASKNVEKVTDVSENITKAVAKEAKVIDKSSDIAKNSESIIDSTKNTVDKTVNILNKNKDLYYEGRKVYTAKELNQMGRVKGGSPNRGVEYIYESPAGKVNAQEFQWGTSGSMMQNTPVGKKNVVPALRYDNPNTEGMNFIKFDGIEVENGVTCLIDAKRNVPYWNKGGMETVKGTLDRIKVAKSQNPGIRVVYEFPNEKAAGHFRKWINNNNGYDGIVEIRVRK